MKLWLYIKCDSAWYATIYFPRGNYGISARKSGLLIDNDYKNRELKSYKSVRLKNRIHFMMDECYEQG